MVFFDVFRRSPLLRAGWRIQAKEHGKISKIERRRCKNQSKIMPKSNKLAKRSYDFANLDQKLCKKRSKTAQILSKRRPRAFQEHPRAPQERARRRQEGPKDQVGRFHGQSMGSPWAIHGLGRRNDGGQRRRGEEVNLLWMHAGVAANCLTRRHGAADDGKRAPSPA